MTKIKYKNIDLKVDFKKALMFGKPSMLIDRLLLYEPDKKVVVQKYLTGKEPFFKGHFPGNPVMPGHMIAETMVQACTLFFGMPGEERKGKFIYLASSKLRFFNAVKPKDKMIITAYPVRMFSRAGIFKADAYVKKKLVATGQFTAAMG